MRTYGIEPKDARVIATSALREADNSDTFCDRIALQTGFSVDIVEDIEENHLMYLAVQKALGEEFRALARANALIIEVGGGSTELMLLRGGRMMAAHSLRIGTVRVDEQVRAAMGSPAYLERYLKDNVRTTCDNLDSDMPLATVRNFVVIGSDARFAARAVGTRSDSGDYCVVPKDSFDRFVEEIQSLRTEGIVAKYRVAHGEAEGYAAGLLITKPFSRTDRRVGTYRTLRLHPRGYLMRPHPGALRHPGERAASTGWWPRPTPWAAASISTRITPNTFPGSRWSFSTVWRTNTVGQARAPAARGAGLLHDVGTFIRTSGHHKHSEYIITNSEIFGLQRDDLTIIANCARYHRKASPASTIPTS